MNKLLLLLLAGSSLTATAQQVQGDFDAEWGNCTPWTSDGNTKTRGTQPQGWCAANVIGMSGVGATTVVSQETGRSGEGHAVKLTNTANRIMASQIVPGYIALGTTWNTSVRGDKNDGGTFGGINFTYRPDALRFYYKRSAATPDNPASVIAYLWSGTYIQKDVPGNIKALGSPNTVDMTDRDCNIMGKDYAQGGEVTQRGKRIASLEHYITDVTDDWTQLTLPLTYNDTEAVPEKLNIVFASSNYFSQDVAKDNSLTIDDVELVYYHSLTSLTYDGQPVAGFGDDDSRTSFAVNAAYDPAKLAYEKKGVGATVEVSDCDPLTGIVTITVKGSDFAQNAESQTVYTVRFNAAPKDLSQVDLSFDNEWTAGTPWTADGNALTYGTQPQGWCAANVIGYQSLGATTVVSQETGRSGEGYAVKLTNTANPMMSTQIVPGYIALGTTWNTSVLGQENDGGTFGGVNFTGRPDALSFSYKRTAAVADNPASVIAYLWNGTYTQKDVPASIALFSSPATVDMTDRDCNIMDKPTAKGGEVTQQGKRIASLEHYITDVTGDDWAELTLPLTYDDTEALPEKLNIVFASSNYFSQDVAEGNTLSVDDVQLVYYHGLASLTYDGQPVPDFAEDAFSYTIDARYDAAKLAYEKRGVAATVEEPVYDAQTGVLTITVKGGDYEQNPASQSVYTLQFRTADKEESTSYTNSVMVNNKVDNPLIESATFKLVHNLDADTYALEVPALHIDGMVEFVDFRINNLTCSLRPDDEGLLYSGTDNVEVTSLPIPFPVSVTAIVRDGKMTATLSIETNADQPVEFTFAPLLNISNVGTVNIGEPGMKNIRVDRLFPTGRTTLCLPFALTTADLGEGAEAWEFTGVRAPRKLTFSSVTELEANKPYVINLQQAANALYFTAAVKSAEPVAVTHEGYTFCGIYDADINADKLFRFNEYGNGFEFERTDAAVQPDVTSAAFRNDDLEDASLYIELEGINTGIAGVTTDNDAQAPVYNLQGVRVSDGSLSGLPAGVYVKGGHKVIVK